MLWKLQCLEEKRSKRIYHHDVRCDMIQQQQVADGGGCCFRPPFDSTFSSCSFDLLSAPKPTRCSFIDNLHGLDDVDVSLVCDSARRSELSRG